MSLSELAVWMCLFGIVMTIPPSRSQDVATVELYPGVGLYGQRFQSPDDPARYGYAFLGIRYGLAGRFEASVENMDFNYLTNQSRPVRGPVCPQGAMPGPPGASAPKVMSEDCLYLDIYVPVTSLDLGQSRLLPVMMYIYGGALQSGDKDSFDASALATAIDAIIVVINYRVNVFGFLSTGDQVAPGNYGLGDCKLALGWIIKHISKFGGDRQAVSVFGESAGATLTSALLLDPLVQAQIRGIVAMSGSVLVDTLYTRDPYSEAVTFATALGCPASSSLQLISCLKQLPMERVAQAAGMASQGRISQRYGMVIDHVHINDLPLRMLQQQVRSPAGTPSILTGYLREDVSFLLQLTFPDLFDANQPLSLERVCEIVARQFLLTSTGSGQTCSRPNYALAQRVLQHFNMTASDTRQQLLWKLFHLGSESQFGYPAAKEASLYTQRVMPGSPVFRPSSQLFQISYDAGTGLGAFHSLDIQHIFANPSPFLTRLEPGVTNSLRQMLQQMAYRGCLRMDAPQFDDGGSYAELDQSARWRLGTTDHLDMIRFWDQVANTPCPN